MVTSFLIFCLLVPTGSPLITPVRGQNGEPDLDSIINHLTLLEQTVQDIPAMKTQMAVLESKLQNSESEITRLTTDLNTCTTNMAVVQSQVQSLQSVKDTCEETEKKVNNLTLCEGALKEQMTNLNTALSDVYNKSVSNFNFLSSMNSIHDLVRIDEWVLAFRAQADNGISVYKTWMDDAIYHDNPLLPWLVGPECQSLQSAHSCPIHFKSKIVPLWETVNVQQVKILLIKNSQIRHQILFDGVGTTKTSWFSRDRVINSTWTDLKTAPVNYFSIEGEDGAVHRRFYINSLDNRCEGDQNWLTVVDDKTGVCYWDKTSSIPQIIYSRGPTRSVTGTDHHDFEYGDVMAILVKLGDV